MKNLFRLIKDYFKAHPVVLTIVVICAFLNALAAIIAPIMLQNTVNLIEIGIKEGFEAISNDFFLYLTLMITFYAISIASGFTYSQLTARYAQMYLHELRVRVFSHLEDLPISYFDKNEISLGCTSIFSLLKIQFGDVLVVFQNDMHIGTKRPILNNLFPQNKFTVSR